MSNSLQPLDCSPPVSSVHGILQARIIVVGCNFLLQGIFPIQGSNLCLLHCKQILYPLNHLDISWALFSPSYQHRSPEVNPRIAVIIDPDPLWVLRGQLRLWPGPTSNVDVPTKSTAAEARPVSATGTFIVHSDILQVLSVQSQLLGYKSIVCVAVRKDFISSSLVAWLLGHSCVYGNHI